MKPLRRKGLGQLGTPFPIALIFWMPLKTAENRCNTTIFSISPVEQLSMLVRPFLYPFTHSKAPYHHFAPRQDCVFRSPALGLFLRF